MPASTTLHRPHRRWLPAARAASLLAALVILWVTFREVSVHDVAALVFGIGLLAAVIPLPQLVGFACETWGWRGSLVLLGRQVRFLPLLRVRVTTDALTHSLPGGVVWCESAALFLLRRHCHLPLTEGLAALAARKYLLLQSQACYVLLIFLLGNASLRTSSARILGGPGLEWLALGIAAVLALAAFALSKTLHRGTVVTRIHGFLGRLPHPRWRHVLREKRTRFLETDEQMARFFGAGAVRLAGPALPFLAGWISESIETYLILRLLGVDLDFTAVASFEVVLAFVRHALLFLPAGLGVQDAGYAAFLAALGAPQALSVGAAFVLLKRSKEVLWAALGYALLAADRGRVTASTGDLGVHSGFGADSAQCRSPEVPPRIEPVPGSGAGTTSGGTCDERHWPQSIPTAT